MCILATTVTIGYYQIASVDSSYSNLINVQAKKVILIKELNIEIKEQQSRLRGYLIVNDEIALTAFSEAHTNFLELSQELQEIVTEPEAVTLLDEVNQLSADYQQYAATVIELKRNNQTEEYTNLVATQGRDISDRFDEKALEFSEYQDAELNQVNEATSDRVASVKIFVLVLGVVGLVVGVVIALYIGRIISKPVIKLAEGAKEIAAGNLMIDDIKVKNRDEIGDLAQSFNEMKTNLKTVIQQVNSTSELVAASAEELTASSEQTTKATEQVANTMQEVSTGVEKQVQSVEETSQTVSEMSIGVNEVANQTMDVSNAAMAASEKALDGGRVIKTAVNQMNSINQSVSGLETIVKELGDRSSHIGNIVEVIGGIAAQTNLLALNASIEAARAGDHGRGFAVVADEVRKLAEQSADSAQQISQLISAIQEETHKALTSMEDTSKEVEEGIGVINTAGRSFDEIQLSVDEVTQQIQGISSAVQQMAAGSEQIAQSMEVITGVAESSASGTQEVAAANEEQLASMEEISSSANALSAMAEELQELISKFKVN